MKVQLTEGQLYRVIEESVRKILKEDPSIVPNSLKDNNKQEQEEQEQGPWEKQFNPTDWIDGVFSLSQFYDEDE